MTAGPSIGGAYWRRRPGTLAGVLLALLAAAFAAASIIHFGVDVPLGLTTVRDHFPGAAPPEAVIAVALAVGAAAVLRRHPSSRGIAVGVTSFAVLGTGYGLRVTAGGARTGDVAYHLSVLVALLGVLALLLSRGESDSGADHLETTGQLGAESSHGQRRTRNAPWK